MLNKKITRLFINDAERLLIDALLIHAQKQNSEARFTQVARQALDEGLKVMIARSLSGVKNEDSL